MRCDHCSQLEYNLMCRCCDNWRIYFWPMPMEIAILNGTHDFVLTSCFTPWHMPRCPALKGLLDKANAINVIDNVLDAIWWESTVTALFKYMDEIEADPKYWPPDNFMQEWVHHRFRREFGRVLELAVQFLYAPVNYCLRSHKGLHYHKALREFMELQPE